MEESIKPTVGSLFSGIGGFELGFEWAGFQVEWQVEINEYARKVLAKHWPNVERHTDVREVGKHNLKPVDVLIGGFPCQDISTAGKGVGIEGERSGLWSEYARIIGELRPRYAVMENVAALLYRGLGRVLGDLAEIGYDAEWQVLPAAAFGAPHQRERIFIVGYPHDDGLDGPQIGASRVEGILGNTEGAHQLVKLERSGSQRTRDGFGDSVRECGESREGYGIVAYSDSAGREEQRGAVAVGQELRPSQRRGSEVAYTPRIYAQGHGRRSGKAQLRRSSWWEAEPSVGRVVDGLPFRVDRLIGLGNAIVPQVAQYIGELVMADIRRRNQ